MQKLHATTEGADYAGVLILEDSPALAPGETQPRISHRRLWKCAHNHRDQDEARACAEAEMARRMS